MSETLTVYQKLCLLRDQFVIAAAEAGAYSGRSDSSSGWSDAYAASRLREVFNNVNRIRSVEKFYDVTFSQRDFQGLTREELLSLGFKHWDNSYSFLVPLYLKNYLVIDESYKAIGGGISMVSDFDDDNRYGCLAYYFNLIN